MTKHADPAGNDIARALMAAGRSVYAVAGEAQEYSAIYNAVRLSSLALAHLCSMLQAIKTQGLFEEELVRELLRDGLASELTIDDETNEVLSMILRETMTMRKDFTRFFDGFSDCLGEEPE